MMSLKRLISRLRPTMPEVSASPAVREALEAALSGLDPTIAAAEEAADALRDALTGVVTPAGRSYIDAIPLPAAELEADLHLLAWAGYVWERSRHIDRAAALAEARAGASATEEYIGFDYRERVRQGPAPLIAAMEKVGLEGREPWSVAAGITGGRLRVERWSGGSEGWFRLALMAWLAGEELAALPADPPR